MLYKFFIWSPSSDFAWEKFDEEHSYDIAFLRNAVVLGTFYSTYGEHDVGPVVLADVGWQELIKNVTKIELVYTPSQQQSQQGKAVFRSVVRSRPHTRMVVELEKRLSVEAD